MLNICFNKDVWLYWIPKYSEFYIKSFLCTCCFIIRRRLGVWKGTRQGAGCVCFRVVRGAGVVALAHFRFDQKARRGHRLAEKFSKFVWWKS